MVHTDGDRGQIYDVDEGDDTRPYEVLFKSGDKFWVAVDKLSRFGDPEPGDAAEKAETEERLESSELPDETSTLAVAGGPASASPINQSQASEPAEEPVDGATVAVAAAAGATIGIAVLVVLGARVWRDR